MKMKFAKPAMILPIVGGGVAAKVVKNLSGKFIKNDKLRAAAPLVVGLLLASNKKTAMIGYGMIAVGGADLAGTIVPQLAGIEDMDLSGVFGPLNDDMGDDISDELGDDMGGPLNDDISDDLGDYGDDYR